MCHALLSLLIAILPGWMLVGAEPEPSIIAIQVDAATAAKHPAEIDAQVERWLADPAAWTQCVPSRYESEPLPDPILDHLRRRTHESPLGWWISQPTPQRWARLQALLADDPAKPATARCIAILGMPWIAFESFESGVGPGDHQVWRALAWLALADQRPLTPALRDYAQRYFASIRRDLSLDQSFRWLVIDGQSPVPAAIDDLRICDLALMQVDPPFFLDADQADQSVPKIFYSWNQPRSARDRSIADVRLALACRIRRELQAAGLPIPSELAALAAQFDAVVPGLTAEETAAITAAYDQARALGLPDLTGATTYQGQLITTAGNPGGDWHVKLADGSWLVDLVWSLPAANVVTAPAPDAHELSRCPATRVPMTIWRRMNGSWLSHAENFNPIIPALARWRSAT